MTTLKYVLARLSAPAMLALVTAAPVVAYAQTGSTAACPFAQGNIASFFLFAICVIDRFIVPLVFALAFIVFIIGVYRYFVAGGANEEKRQEGQRFVLWGLIGFVLMFSVWGIINLLVTSLGLNGSTRPDLPIFIQSNRGSTNQGVQSSPTLPTSDTNTDINSNLDNTPPY